MSENFDTEFYFDPIITYGYLNSKNEVKENNEKDDDSFDVETLEKIVDYIYMFDAKKNFTVKNITNVIYPEYTFIRVLTQDIFDELNLDQVQGIVIRRNKRDECAIVIAPRDENDKKGENDDDDDDQFYCFIDDDLLEKRLKSQSDKETMQNISIFVIGMLLIVSLFYLLFK